ncbi:MAG TPA: universal stress protein [Minicystis sp.]|nr:universal stress protein [Minicystis sp.]
MKLFQHILVATDFSACAALAVDVAVDLAQQFGAKLTLLHVFEPPLQYDMGWSYPIPPMVDLQAVDEQALEAELERLRARFPAIEAVSSSGSAWRRILAIAKARGADLVVMGTHGRHGLPRALLGSVAEKVVRMSEVPVLTVRLPGAAEAPEKVADSAA